MSIALVQSTVRTISTAASSFGATLASPVTTGSTVIIVATMPSSANWFSSITDAGGNTWTFLASALVEVGSGPFTNGGNINVYYAPNVVGGWTTTQLNIAPGNQRACMIIREYSGLVENPYTSRQAFSQIQQQTSPYLSPGVTSPQPNCLALAWAGVKSAVLVMSASGGFTNLSSTNNLAGLVSQVAADLIVANPQAITSYFTATGTNNIATGVLLFNGQFDDEGNSLGATGSG